MRTNWMRYALAGIVMAVCIATSAQTYERKYARRGNTYYRDTMEVDSVTLEKAEVKYRKAVELNPVFAEAYYNLGNTLMRRNKAEDAIKQYDAVGNCDTSKALKAKAYRNQGTIYQGQEQYQQAIESYKNSLRNDPNNDEVRYNLALCQYLLKKQQEQKQDDKNQEDPEGNNEKDQQDKQNPDKQQQKEQPDEKKNQQQQNQQPQPQQQDPQKMSKETAEQLLQAAMQDEKDTQKKVQQQPPAGRRRLEKRW